jgi:hypothetical protein
MLKELLNFAAKVAVATVVVITTSGALELAGGAIVAASQGIKKKIEASK